LVTTCSSYFVEKAVNGKVFVLGVKNFGWNNNFVKIDSGDDVVNRRVYPLRSVLMFNESVKDKVAGYIDVLRLVSDAGAVRIFDETGNFITYDTNHLTKSGAKYVGSILFDRSPLSILKDVSLRTSWYGGGGM